MMANLKGSLMARGADAASATNQSLGALFGIVERQASMLSFLETFRLFAIIFIVVLPLLLIMRRPAGRGGAAPMH